MKPKWVSMAKKKYIIRKSNYALYERHKDLNGDKIVYERDYMTLNDGGVSNGMRPYGESNFSIMPARKAREQRSINLGEWVAKEECSEDCEVWTYNDVKDIVKGPEDEIRLNTNQSNLRDFVYYGSAYETIKKSIDNIIKTYPAELYVSEYSYEDLYGKHCNTTLKESLIEQGYNIDPVVIYNPFEIDVISNDINSNLDIKDGESDLHYMSLSSKDYRIINKDEYVIQVKWDVSNKNKKDIKCYHGEVINTITLSDCYVRNERPFIIYECLIQNEDTDRSYYKRIDDAKCTKVKNENDGTTTMSLTTNDFGLIVGTTLKITHKKDGIFKAVVTSKDGNTYTLSSDDTIKSIDGDTTFDRLVLPTKNNGTILVCDRSFVNVHIRPSFERIEKYFNELSDIERLILNRRSKPMYTMFIDTPKWDDRIGMTIHKKRYTWPTVNGWNLDVTSARYTNYLTSVLNVCEILDEYYTNNLWKNMVHDSIKNMDLTYMNQQGDFETEDYSIGMSKMEKLMYTYGEFFDDIKRYIDNIRNTNTLTYSGNNNMPYYFLTDVLELSGWETKNVVNTLNDTETEVIYDGYDYSFKKKDANIQFMKNLKLNSKAILSRKGTRHGIEMIMGLFGLRSYDFARALYDLSDKSDKIKKPNSDEDVFEKFDDIPEDTRVKLYDYRIDEFICVASPRKTDYKYDMDDISEEEGINSYKLTDEQKENIIKTGNLSSENTNRGIDGLPITEVYEFSEEEGAKKYYIPWFDKKKKYDGGLYYQMYGGWCKMSKKDIKTNLTSKTEITSNNDYSLYDESVKDIKIVPSVHSLTESVNVATHNGMIFRVLGSSNIKEDIESVFGVEIDDRNDSDFSEFFIINDIENIDKYQDDNTGGWRNIPKSEIEEGIDDGLKLLNADSMVDSTLGNAPHKGNYSYDDGIEYFKYFQQLFKYSIDNDLFNVNGHYCNEGDNQGEILDEIKEVGFKFTDDDEDIEKIEYVKDNIKCWYFKNDDDSSSSKEILRLQRTLENESDYSFYEYDDFEVTVGEKRVDSLSDSNLVPFNYKHECFGGENYNCIESSYSIMNNKKLLITFNKINADNFFPEISDYINNVVMFYAKQVIPSTSIFEIKHPDDNVDEKGYDNCKIANASGFVGDTEVQARANGIDSCINFENPNLYK